MNVLIPKSYHVYRLAAPNVEDKLRKLGFGYRAKFIQSSAQ